MHLKRNDMVKLLPTWPLPNSDRAPAWGGPLGYKLGRVMSVHTGDHDSKKHFANVEFPTNSSAQHFPESALEKATEEEIEIAGLFAEKKAYGQDIWTLIKTSSGKFGLNVIETSPMGMTGTSCVAGISRNVLTYTENSDFNLVGSLLSMKDYHEVKTNSIYAAAMQIHAEWGLPVLPSVPLPLRTYTSIREAIETAPKDSNPASLMFHLSMDMVDFAIEVNSVGE